jgi:hypothetical protein
VQLIDDGGLADTGISGNKHHLRRAAGYNAVKRREQGIDLAILARTISRESESVRRIVCTQCKRVDPSPRFPFSNAVSKITLNAGRGLIAFLSGLREELQNDGRDRYRDIFNRSSSPPAASRYDSEPTPWDGKQ